MILSKILKVWILVIFLVLSSNSHAAYVNHHYKEKTEEKFVSEYMINSNVVVVTCHIKFTSIFSDNPSLKTTFKKCEENKRILEKLNRVKYKFGKVRGYLPYSQEVTIELIEEVNND